MRFLLSSLFTLLFLFVPGVIAQKFLEKPYSEWGKGDAQKIISESGWAKQYSSNVAAAAADASNIPRSQTSGSANRGGGNPGSVAQRGGNLPVVIRLHSSPVVRQATVRLQQIGAGYDKMNADEKAKFDQSRQGFLECAICKDYYVITITKYIDASGVSAIAARNASEICVG